MFSPVCTFSLFNLLSSQLLSASTSHEYVQGVIKDNDHLLLKPLAAQKFISRAEVIIAKSPHMASKALKHLNDHFIILSAAKLVDTIFVSPFLIETIVNVVAAKPYFVDLLVRLINFPKIRVVFTTAFIGNARKIAPASSSAPGSPIPFARSDGSDTDSRSSTSSSHSDYLPEWNQSALALSSSPSQLLLPSKTNSLDAGTNISPASLPAQLTTTHAQYLRETSLRKMDVFALVRDTLEHARLPYPHTNFFRYLLDDRMNEGIITRGILLLNCLLGIAELTVVWGDMDEAAPASASRESAELEGVNGVVGTNRYNAFKNSIIVAGVIDTLMKYAMKEKPMPTLRSAISGFQDHLLRPLGTLPSPQPFFRHLI